jgi:hypothetical protein
MFGFLFNLFPVIDQVATKTEPDLKGTDVSDKSIHSFFKRYAQYVQKDHKCVTSHIKYLEGNDRYQLFAYPIDQKFGLLGQYNRLTESLTEIRLKYYGPGSRANLDDCYKHITALVYAADPKQGHEIGLELTHIGPDDLNDINHYSLEKDGISYSVSFYQSMITEFIIKW